jgi:hypothetical protein
MSGPGKQKPGPAGGGNRAKLELTAAMRNLTKPTEFGNNENRFNSDFLQPSRPDWRISDQVERAKFRQIRHFVSRCHEIWPDAKITIRAHDRVCVDLAEPQS